MAAWPAFAAVWRALCAWRAGNGRRRALQAADRTVRRMTLRPSLRTLSRPVAVAAAVATLCALAAVPAVGEPLTAQPEDRLQDVAAAYARAVLVGRVTGSRDVTVTLTDLVSHSVGPDSATGDEDVAGPPDAPPQYTLDGGALAGAPPSAPVVDVVPSELPSAPAAPALEEVAGGVVQADGSVSPAGVDALLSGPKLAPATAGPLPDTSGGTSGGAGERLPAGTPMPGQPWVCPTPAWTWFTHDWGFPRGGGRTHKGNDIFAPEGSPLVAAVDGIVVKVRTTDTSMGGITVNYLTADNTIVYNAHLQSVTPGIAAGVRVVAGQQIGTVGRTGNARTTPAHLHIGVYDAQTDVALDPWPWTARACRR